MSENELMSISDKVVARIQRNELGSIQAELSGEAVENLIAGCIDVVGRVSGDTFHAVTEIYTQAIWAQERLEMKNMNDIAEVMRRFNDQVDFVMKQLDLKDSKSVDNFVKTTEALRKLLRDQISSIRKPSILEKIGSLSKCLPFRKR